MRWALACAIDFALGRELGGWLSASLAPGIASSVGARLLRRPGITDQLKSNVKPQLTAAAAKDLRTACRLPC